MLINRRYLGVIDNREQLDVHTGRKIYLVNFYEVNRNSKFKRRFQKVGSYRILHSPNSKGFYEDSYKNIRERFKKELFRHVLTEQI